MYDWNNMPQSFIHIVIREVIKLLCLSNSIAKDGKELA